MNYSNIRWQRRQNYPVLVVDIDGQEAVISTDQKPTLMAMKAVYVGDEFSDYVLEIPEDPSIGRSATRVRGAVQDDDFWEKVWLPFITATHNGTFKADTACSDLNS